MIECSVLDDLGKLCAYAGSTELAVIGMRNFLCDRSVLEEQRDGFRAATVANDVEGYLSNPQRLLRS